MVICRCGRRQAAAGSGGAALRSGGEGEGGGGAEERDQLGQAGSSATPRASRGNREREEPAEIRRGGAGTGRRVQPAGFRINGETTTQLILK